MPGNAGVVRDIRANMERTSLPEGLDHYGLDLWALAGNGIDAMDEIHVSRTRSPAELRVPLQNESHGVRPGFIRSLGCLVVLVDHAAEHFASLDWQVQRWADLAVLVGRPLLAGLVRAVPAVMAGVLAEN